MSWRMCYAEWERILKKSPELVWDKVNKVDDLVNDEQLIANRYINKVDHPVLGSINLVGSPVIFHKTPAATEGIAPEIGEHTEQVLTELCECSWDDIANLKSAEVIP